MHKHHIHTFTQMRVLAIALLFLFIPACKTTKYSADKLPEKQLIIGSQGGFTGFGSEFIFCESGQVFKRSTAYDKIEELKITKKSKLRNFFKKAWEQPWLNEEYVKPGNFSSIMIFKDKELLKKYVWSQSDTAINPSIRLLAEEAKKLINQNSDK